MSKSIVTNRYKFIFSILINKKTYTIKLSDGTILHFTSDQQQLVHQLLGILTYSTNWKFKSGNLDISFDGNTYFTISIPPKT